MILFTFILFVSMTLYSYVLVDPNITLIQSPIWAQFRDVMVTIGYYHRDISAILFLLLLTVASIFHFFAVKQYEKFPLKKYLIIAGFLLLCSYPFLSKDIFNYLFDAKIVTTYGGNPYVLRALDFPSDPWLRFMHWIHRTYPYGPTFLPITLVPSFLSFGKLLLDLLFFKVLFIGAYILTTWTFLRIDKKWAVFFATSPLVLFEGLVNTHNDLISLALAAVGLYYISKQRYWSARLWVLLSVGIKYISFPVFLLTIQSKKHQKKLQIAALLSTIVIILYASKTIGVFQPWYLLNIFVFLPYFERIFYRSSFFLTATLLSYYPFIRYGDWGEKGTVEMKNAILFAIVVIYLMYIGVPFIRKHAEKNITV